MRLTIAFAAALLGLAAAASAQAKKQPAAGAKQKEPIAEQPAEEPGQEGLPKPKTVEELKRKPLVEKRKEFPEGAMVVDLVAGETWIAGTVAVWNDDESLYVEYEAADGWLIHRSQMDAELDWADIPQKEGNPRPGRFEFRDKYGSRGVTLVTYEIPLVDRGWVDGDLVYVAAHARLSFGVKRDRIREGAWGEGDGFPGTDEAMYIPFQIEIGKKKAPISKDKKDEEMVPPEETEPPIDAVKKKAVEEGADAKLEEEASVDEEDVAEEVEEEEE